MHLIVILLEKYPTFRVSGLDASQSPLWFSGSEVKHFFRLLFNCLMCPTSPDIGFSFYEIDDSATFGARKGGHNAQNSKAIGFPSLRSITSRLCKLLLIRLPETEIQAMLQELRQILAQPEFDLLSIDFFHANFNIQNVTVLVSGYEQLHECKLLLPYLNSPSTSRSCASDLGEKLVTSIFDFAHKYDPLQCTVAGQLLQLAMNLNVSVKSFLKFLLVCCCLCQVSLKMD